MYSRAYLPVRGDRYVPPIPPMYTLSVGIAYLPMPCPGSMRVGYAPSACPRRIGYAPGTVEGCQPYAQGMLRGG